MTTFALSRQTLILLGVSFIVGIVGGELRSVGAAGTRYSQGHDAYRDTLNQLDSAHVDVTQRQRLIGELRRYRIRLLDSKRKAEASDDDDEAAMLEVEINKLDRLILDAQAALAVPPSVEEAASNSLPAGLEEGLVLHYRFDEHDGLRAIDTTIHGNHGLVKGARWSRHGRQGGAYWFDGLDDYIEVGASESLRLDNEFTVSICVFRKSGDAAVRDRIEYLFSRGIRSGSDLWLYIAPGGGVGAGLRDEANEGRSLRINAEPSRQHIIDGKWTHLVLTYDGRAVRTYVNGREDKVMLLPGGVPVSDGALHIGRTGHGQSRYGFKGKLDDVIIWTRALKEVEVLGLWAALIRLDE